jgi:hypothetical protein
MKDPTFRIQRSAAAFWYPLRADGLDLRVSQSGPEVDDSASTCAVGLFHFPLEGTISQDIRRQIHMQANS